VRRRAARGKSFRRTSVILVGAALLGALGVKCRPDKLLDNRSPPKRENPTPRPEPPPRSPPKAKGPAEAPGSVHLALGTPADSDPSDDLVLIKPQYALSYNKDRNVSNWVSWNLDEAYFGDVPRHKGRFLSDESLPAGVYRVRDQDYAGSGFDRGHLVRSEERTRTPEDNKATFLLTNVLPQRHDLNAGPWLRLEDYSQALSQKAHQELFIMAGGVWNPRPETIGRGVAVPGSCFKIIVVLDRGQGAKDVTASTRVIAVLMPNTTGILNEGWGGYRTTVDEIERQTGYNFLPAVPEEIQRAIEARIDDDPTAMAR
jgi:endonuclease G, mitochondrial